ncbi:MAG: hypothetical protein ACFFCU_17585 [Promethearchaeota archaeon]
MSYVDKILNLDEELRRETETHLQLKVELSQKLNELSSQESALSDRLIFLNEKVTKITKDDITKVIDISQLIQTNTYLENEINELREKISTLEQQLAQISSQRSVIDSKIQALEDEKREQEKKALEFKQKQTETKNASNKLKNEKEKLEKIINRVNEQKDTKNNLEIFLKTLDIIQQVINSYYPLKESRDPSPLEIPQDIQEEIMKAKNCFEKAQTIFNPNDLVPFLVDADQAYRNIISAFIKLCDNIPNSLLEKDFSDQIFTLVDKGLMLNTRHLNAVQSMLMKLEKGIEIAPLASFSNEIQSYFVENLTYLRVIGWIILEPSPS